MKYSMFYRQIPEIPALRPEKDLKNGELAVHRTRNCVVYFDNSRRLKTSYENSRHKSLNSSHLGTSELVEVDRIYDEISRSFFDESLHPGALKLRDEEQTLSKRTHKKQQATLHLKLKSMQAVKDSQIKDIKSRIQSSTRRVKLSKAGNSNESQQITKESSNSFIVQNQSESPNRSHRKKLIDSHRNLTFEQKLEFYEEHPLLTERRIMTSHLPWEKPEIPLVTSTPENSKFFQIKTEGENQGKMIVLKFGTKKAIRLDYLKNPALLGHDGGKLLLQIMRDEKQNVKASNEEILELNKIIFRRIRKMKQKEKGWEQDIVRYAVDKVNLLPTCNPSELINSYFD
jgi:hypothetical protein